MLFLNFSLKCTLYTQCTVLVGNQNYVGKLSDTIDLI